MPNQLPPLNAAAIRCGFLMGRKAACMKKWMLCLGAVLILASASTGAAGVEISSAWVQEIVSQYQEQALQGEALRGKEFDSQSVAARFGSAGGALDCIDAKYILKAYSRNGDAQYGVIDFANGRVIVPFQYDAVFVLSSNQFLLANIDEETSVSDCYAATTEGAIEPLHLPLDGEVVSVDEKGFIVLGKRVDRPYRDIHDAEESAATTMSVYQYALLNENLDIVLDYVIDGGTHKDLGIVEFIDDVAAIRTGSTLWRGTPSSGNWGNGSCGLIDRSGSYVSANDFSDIYRKNGRIVGMRKERRYLLHTNGAELPLRNDYYEYQSDWAKAELRSAMQHHLVPERLQQNYTLDIHRDEFCTLAMRLYTQLGGVAPTIDKTFSFTDSEDADILKAAALGIVTGYGDGSFRPQTTSTRQEAAAMLGRLCAVLRPDENGQSTGEPFADDTDIAAWARESVYAVRAAGVMKGVENNCFQPLGHYTVEQAIVTMERLYNQML